LGRIVLGEICSSNKVVLLGRIVRKIILCRSNSMANKIGEVIQWRCKRKHGSVVDEITRAFRAIQARLEDIETT